MKASRYQDRGKKIRYIVQNEYGFWLWADAKWRRFVSGDWYWVEGKWCDCSWLEVLLVTGTAKEHLSTILKAEWGKDGM